MLMVAVAIAAIVLGALRERHLRFKKMAAHHFPRSGGVGVNGIASVWVKDSTGRLIPLDDSERFGREMWWHREMYDQYEYASLHLWLPISSDPPPDW
jgi:hypothetical protein